jgi:hypothetical protein
MKVIFSSRGGSRSVEVKLLACGGLPIILRPT